MKKRIRKEYDNHENTVEGFMASCSCKCSCQCFFSFTRTSNKGNLRTDSLITLSVSPFK